MEQDLNRVLFTLRVVDVLLCHINYLNLKVLTPVDMIMKVAEANFTRRLDYRMAVKSKVSRVGTS